MSHETSDISLTTHSADETRQLGKEIGKRLMCATTIRLLGDLGSGKTCFVQGLAKGLAVPSGYDITSPTYALIHEYPGRLPLVHVDLYRIHDEMDAEAIGLHEILGKEMVFAVEWADRLSDDFWRNTPILNIDFKNQKDGSRRLRLFGYGHQISDLIEEIKTKSKLIKHHEK
jgi:tRNA threonylcarbamoyladenosine biosynthesis protein TsaE